MLQKWEVFSIPVPAGQENPAKQQPSHRWPSQILGADGTIHNLPVPARNVRYSPGGQGVLQTLARPELSL